MVRIFPGVAALCAALLWHNAQALELGRTRLVVEPGQRSEAAVLRVGNPAAAPALVQAWLEPFEGAADEVDAALFATPPLQRLEPGAEGFVRLVPRPGGALPRDRESLFTLAVQALPWDEEPTAAGLRLHLQHRLKVIYRPRDLAGSPAAAARGLRWALVEGPGTAALEVHNDSPFVVVIAAASVRPGDQAAHHSQEAITLLPYSRQRIAAAAAPTGAVHYEFIDDRGERIPARSSLTVKPS